MKMDGFSCRMVTPRRTSISYGTSVGAPRTGANARLKSEANNNEVKVAFAELNTIEEIKEVLKENGV